MAEVSFSRLDHRVRPGQPVVNRIGPGWDDQRVARDDPVTHLPLQLPGGDASPPPELHTPPPAPTEQQLLDLLHECRLARDFTANALADAEASHGRAVEHVAGCRAHVAEFDDLDATITERMVEALRAGGGRPRGGMDDELRLRMAERDIAVADARASERVLAVLAEALAEAQAEAAQATQAARRAAGAVLGIEAVGLAERHESLLAEVSEIRTKLAQFDRCVSGTGATIPQAVMGVLLDPGSGLNLARDIGTGEWGSKLSALLDAEPEAAVNSLPAP